MMSYTKHHIEDIKMSSEKYLACYGSDDRFSNFNETHNGFQNNAQRVYDWNKDEFVGVHNESMLFEAFRSPPPKDACNYTLFLLIFRGTREKSPGIYS